MSKKEKRRYASARERADKVKQGFTSTYLKVPEGTQLFSPKAGRYLLDILPYTVGEGNKWAEEGALYYERTFYIHRNVGASQESFICPRMTAKSPCPICEHRARLMKQNDEDNEELIQSLAPKERQIFNLMNLKEPDKGVQLFTSSYHTFGKLLDTRLRGADEEDNWDGFFTLEDGLTLKVMFADESLGGYSFVTAESMDFRPRREVYDEDILKETLCLDELLIIPEYDDLKKAFLETETDDDEDEDEPKSKRRHRHEEEDEDDEKPSKRKSKDEDDEEEGEEEPKAKRKAPKDEDEDWDEVEDDDEEDEKPAKRKSKDEDEEEEEEEDEDEPKAKRKPKDDDEDEWEQVESKSKRKSKDDDDEEEEEDDDDEEEEEDEDEKPAKGKLFPRGKGKVRAGAKDDEDDED